MSLADTRSSETAMRDLLRRLERAANSYAPARPTEPPSLLRMAPSPSAVDVFVGQWRLHEDPETGDLMATDPDGNVHTLIRKGTS